MRVPVLYQTCQVCRIGPGLVWVGFRVFFGQKKSLHAARCGKSSARQKAACSTLLHTPGCGKTSSLGRIRYYTLRAVGKVLCSHVLGKFTHTKPHVGVIPFPCFLLSAYNMKHQERKRAKGSVKPKQHDTDNATQLSLTS